MIPPIPQPSSWLRRSALALCVACVATSAVAALKPGAPAPLFKTEAAVAGKPFAFDMAAALQKGPVVLYFFQKAFTQGCTVEANAFAEATPRFAALGASVVGMSRDNIDSMRVPNIASGKLPGLERLGIEPTPLEAVAPRYLGHVSGEKRLEAWRARARLG